MVEKDVILKEKIEHSGVFDFKGLYNFAHLWFKNEDFGVVEDKYSEKVSGSTKDIAIEWTAAKGVSDFFKIEIKVKFDISGLSDVEVETDGKKKSANKGKVSVEIKGTLARDPNSKWDETPFLKFLRDTYSKYVVPKRIEDMQIKTSDVVKEFKEQLKAYLESTGKRVPI